MIHQFESGLLPSERLDHRYAVTISIVDAGQTAGFVKNLWMERICDGEWRLGKAGEVLAMRIGSQTWDEGSIEGDVSEGCWVKNVSLRIWGTSRRWVCQQVLQRYSTGNVNELDVTFDLKLSQPSEKTILTSHSCHWNARCIKSKVKPTHRTPNSLKYLTKTS